MSGYAAEQRPRCGKPSEPGLSRRKRIGKRGDRETPYRCPLPPNADSSDETGRSRYDLYPAEASVAADTPRVHGLLIIVKMVCKLVLSSSKGVFKVVGYSTPSRGKNVENFCGLRYFQICSKSGPGSKICKGGGVKKIYPQHFLDL